MGKISPVSAKYLIHTQFSIEGVVDKPDIIGSIFGQTEGLLGSDMELRELQRSGRIGRIEVEIEVKGGKTSGALLIPSSMDKTETVLIAAAMETIQRIGPCNAHVKVTKIEDVRISKRTQMVDRAKELLRELTHSVMPDSRDIKELVEEGVKVSDVMEYGKDRLPAGPVIDESEELIVVEGRADVIALLKSDIRNCIAMNGTSVPQTIIELSRRKTLTILVDGDRGGDLIVKELSLVGDIDFVAKAPDGKEVEELTKKEILKALRGKITMEQAKTEMNHGGETRAIGATGERVRERPPMPVEQRPMMSADQRPIRQERNFNDNNRDNRFQRFDQRRDQEQGRRDFRPQSAPVPRPRQRLSKQEADSYKKLLDDLIGTRGAYLLNESLNILGKVPTTELANTVAGMSSGSIHAVVFDGSINRELCDACERAGVKVLIGKENDGVNNPRVSCFTPKDLNTEN